MRSQLCAQNSFILKRRQRPEDPATPPSPTPHSALRIPHFLPRRASSTTTSFGPAMSGRSESIGGRLVVGWWSFHGRLIVDWWSVTGRLVVALWSVFSQHAPGPGHPNSFRSIHLRKHHPRKPTSNSIAHKKSRRLSCFQSPVYMSRAPAGSPVLSAAQQVEIGRSRGQSGEILRRFGEIRGRLEAPFDTALGTLILALFAITPCQSSTRAGQQDFFARRRAHSSLRFPIYCFQSRVQWTSGTMTNTDQGQP